MILIDTSIWIDHLRSSEPDLVMLLEQGLAAIHPFILGEIALGHLHQRGRVLTALAGLPSFAPAPDEAALAFIDAKHLAGIGIGYVDAHLLVATALTPGATLWTRDRRLHAAAQRLALSAN